MQGTFVGAGETFRGGQSRSLLSKLKFGEIDNQQMYQTTFQIEKSEDRPQAN